MLNGPVIGESLSLLLSGVGILSDLFMLHGRAIFYSFKSVSFPSPCKSHLFGFSSVQFIHSFIKYYSYR